MKNYTDEEIEKHLFIIKSNIKNYEEIFNRIYQNLTFGKNLIKHFNKKIKQDIFLNIRLLEKHLTEKEEYEKLQQIVELKQLINLKPKIKISQRLILTPINLN